jgi:hypothetical protein
MSVMSQSVIIVGSSSAPPFPGPRTVPNYTYDSTAINIAIQKHANLLQYGSWLSGSIFNSGSSGINSVNSSGFTSLVAFPSSTIKSFHILESQEALCIITEYNNQFGYTLAGAFIDPETSLVGLNAEIDGNIYAISTTPLVGQYTIPNWLAGVTPSSLIHSGSNNKTSPKFVYYMPGTDSRFVASYNYSSVVSTNKMCIFYHTTYNNSDAVKQQRAEQETYNKVAKTAIETYAKEKVGLDELFTSVTDVTLSSEQRSNLITEINNKYGDYLPNLLTEKSTNEEIADAYDLAEQHMSRVENLYGIKK